jgi:cytosine/adenosine deaminase-related metal-dependent hydrolase
MGPKSWCLVIASACALVACGGSNRPSGGAGDDGGGSGDDGAPGGGDGGVITLPDGAVVTGVACAVVSTGTAGLLLDGTVLLPAGPAPGEVLVAPDGTIACAAASCAGAKGYAAATHIACPGGVISPALVNAHDHTEYATTAPAQLGNTRYACRNEWRTGADGATPLPKVSSTSSAAIIAAQELRMVMGGTTSIVGSGGVGGLARNLADYSNQGYLEGLSGKTVYFDTFPLGDSNGTVLTSGCGYPSVRSTGSAFADGMYAPHVAEGINAAAENEYACASQAGLVTARTAVIHGVGANANDVGVVAKAGARLVWSPRSNLDLYGDTADVTDYAAQGVTIALGTDWLPSGSMNELRELACADSFNQKYLHGAFGDQQLFEMATKNAAIAAVFDARANAGYRAVLAAGAEDVLLVLRGGKALYGNKDLVAPLAQGCAELDVCGNPRTVCIDTPSTTLASIQSAASGVYPLFFCKGQAPTAEPSCTPYRATYANGITATDQDGDGVADATDDCPTVFNPVRPMDGGKQSDVDGDGAGDACDAKPLDASAH